MDALNALNATLAWNASHALNASSAAAANASGDAAAAAGFNSSFNSSEADMGDYDDSGTLCLDRGGGDAEAWVREVMRLVLAAAILFSNTFIIAVVLRSWAHDGRPLGRGASASFLVLNLAAADALLGLFMVGSWIQDNVCYVYEEMRSHVLSCLLGQLTTQFFDCVSALTIIVIAIDRAMSVSHTARCRNFLNSRRTLVVIASTWVLGLLLALTMLIPGIYLWDPRWGCLLDEAYDESMLWGTVAIMLTTMFCCYWRIHRVTLQMVRRGSLPAPRKQARTKAARMLLLIFIWDSFAYLPLLIATIMTACGTVSTTTFKDMSSNLTLLTFLADPYIYAYSSQHTKKAIQDFIACFRRDPREELDQAGRRESIPGASMKRFRHIISTITNTSSASDEEKEKGKTDRQSPTVRRNSLITRDL